MKKEETLGYASLRLLVHLMMSAFGTLINGFIFMKFWGWFIVPPFGVIELSFIHSTGIIFAIKWITYRRKKVKENERLKKTVKRFIYSLLLTAMIFGIGWIITLFQ